MQSFPCCHEQLWTSTDYSCRVRASLSKINRLLMNSNPMILLSEEKEVAQTQFLLSDSPKINGPTSQKRQEAEDINISVLMRFLYIEAKARVVRKLFFLKGLKITCKEYKLPTSSYRVCFGVFLFVVFFCTQMYLKHDEWLAHSRYSKSIC